MRKSSVNLIKREIENIVDDFHSKIDHVQKELDAVLAKKFEITQAFSNCKGFSNNVSY